METVIIALVVVAAVFVLGAAVAAIANVRVPPLAVVAAWCAPVALALWWTRSTIEAAVADSIAELGFLFWLPVAAGKSSFAFATLSWVAIVVALVCPLVVLLAAVGGAIRGPRRWWRFGTGLVLTVVTVIASLVSFVIFADALSPTAMFLPPYVALVGLGASVALLGGGERGGPSAAAIGAVTAGFGITMLGVWIVGFGEIEVLKAVATAPPEMKPTLLAGGYSLLNSARVTALVATTGGLAIAALGIGSAGRVGAAIGAAAIAITLPSVVLGTDSSALIGGGAAQMNRAPRAEISADVLLPSMPSQSGPDPRKPEVPLVEVTPEAVRWVTPGSGPEVIQGDLTPGIVLARWPVQEGPLERPPALVVVDRRVRAERAVAVWSAVMAERDAPPTLLVDAGRGEQPLVVAYRLQPVASIPDNAVRVEVDAALAQAADCDDGDCTSDQVAQAIRALDRPTDRDALVLVHPDAPMGLVLAVADGRGALGGSVQFLPRAALDAPAEAP